ncbi:unnamed protein product [marine sediment metagenome]|uniref:Uncharacterized protein n=1 Tax=marine sediment metagenome TaxID=412755 RepID=X1SL91_9ZZZZ
MITRGEFLRLADKRLTELIAETEALISQSQRLTQGLTPYGLKKIKAQMKQRSEAGG